jgi:hypothetical protein
MFVGELFGRQKISSTPDLTKAEAIRNWELDGSGEWKIAEGKLMIVKAGVPSGAIRRPGTLAILKTAPLRIATIQADIHSTAPIDVVRRDLDFVVSYESPARFYYIHLAGVTDDVHNGIFLVNNADRVRIGTPKPRPQLQDTAWHHIKVQRDGDSGRISVFANGSVTPVMAAVDTTIRIGRMGVGSFDDTGEFRRIIVTGTSNK